MIDQEEWFGALAVLNRIDRSQLPREQVAEVNNLRASCLLRTGDADESIVAAMLALQLSEDGERKLAAQRTLGAAYLAVGRPHDSLALLQKVVTWPHPSPRVNAECWYILGEALFAVDRRVEAHDAFRTAVSAEPDGPWAKRAETFLAREAGYR
jgi:tetratricopeptide (TPR) repeat protein